MLNRQDIQRAVQQGKILLYPANAPIEATSIDLTLGLYYYREKASTGGASWDGFHKADQNGRIILKPRETILAHTQEFVGALPPYASSLHCLPNIQSMVCWGQPGYVNRWPLVISNPSSINPLILTKGQKVGSLVFYKPDSQALFGDQQDESPLDFEQDVIRRWRPQHILSVFSSFGKQPLQQSQRRPQTAPPATATTPLHPPSSAAGADYKEQVQVKNREHQERMAKKRKLPKLPEPKRDSEGKPILPAALQGISTKSGKSDDLPKVAEYDAEKI